MQQEICQECNEYKPVNELVLFEEKRYCQACLTEKEADGFISEDQIVKMIDDTVCTNCHFDNGDNKLKKLLNLPLCEKCYRYIINRPFPGWIKVSALGLIIIVLFGLYYNSRYLTAYLDIRQANRYFQTGKLEEAYQTMNSAVIKLPHLAYLKGLAHFYEGVFQLSANEMKKALSHFESYQKYYPADENIEIWILKAKSGLAYDLKDYQTFYTFQKRLYQLDSEDVITIAGVASGAACLYVKTKQEKYKAEMNEYFELAYHKIQPGQREILNEYIQRIKYRIFSGEILSSQEYYERFPGGWKGEINK